MTLHVPAIYPDLRVRAVSPPTAVDLRVPVAPPTSVDLRVPVVSLVSELNVSLPLSPVYPVAAPGLASCLSPGPTYEGPPIDRGALPWPLSNCPDWPMNPAWLEFAFARVDLAPEPNDDSFSFNEHNDSFR